MEATECVRDDDIGRTVVTSRAGKTILLQRMANAIAENHPEIKLLICSRLSNFLVLIRATFLNLEFPLKLLIGLLLSKLNCIVLNNLSDEIEHN